MNYKLHSGAGDHIGQVAKKAKEIAKERKVVVEFDFNEIKCLVDETTVTDWLVNYYMDAHIMEWKEIGPDYHSEYDVDTKIELYTRRLAQAQKRKADMEKQQKEDDVKKHEVEQKTTGVQFEILPGKEKEYADYVEKNSKDGYSRAVIEYSEGWAILMQIEIEKGRTIKECADETQKPMDYIGITGFQYGCAVNGLSHYWKHGEDLRKWHNKEYGHEGEGVVNPAILTVGGK